MYTDMATGVECRLSEICDIVKRTEDRDRPTSEMVRAELKFLRSPDADPLNTFRPNGDFGILVQALVGPEGAKGEESFDFLVCTPEWFASDCLPRTDSIATGRHVLFVRQFNYQTLENFVRSYCASCEGQTWSDVADKLARLGHWEFEDYRP